MTTPRNYKIEVAPTRDEALTTLCALTSELDTQLDAVGERLREFHRRLWVAGFGIEVWVYLPAEDGESSQTRRQLGWKRLRDEKCFGLAIHVPKHVGTEFPVMQLGQTDRIVADAHLDQLIEAMTLDVREKRALEVCHADSV